MEQMILQYIQDNPNSTMPMIAEGLSISYGTASHNVYQLRKMAKIRRDVVGYVYVEPKKPSKRVSSKPRAKERIAPIVVVIDEKPKDPWGRLLKNNTLAE